MFKKKKTNKEVHKHEIPEEVIKASQDAVQDCMNLAVISYNRETKTFDREKIEESLNIYDNYYGKKHLAFIPMFDSLLEMPNIIELVEKIIDEKIILRPATEEQMAEIEAELAKEEKGEK